MSKNKLVPKLRFKEFKNSDYWNINILKETLSLLKDGTHGTHRNVESDYFLLSAKNIKNGQIEINTDEDRTISKKEFNKIHSNFRLKQNDVLLTVVGSIGESAIIKDPSHITFQRSVAYLRPNEKLYSYFIFSMIYTDHFQKDLKSQQVVSAQPGVYLNKLNTINIVYPELKEQKKIGKFFEKIDKMIQLQQSKVNKIKALKAAYLSEMFPKEGEKYPKKRFAGFTEQWCENKFNEITEYITSSLSANNTLIKGKYELYDANELIGYTNSSGQKQEYVTIIKDGSGVGRVRLLPRDTNFIGTMGAIISNEKTDIHYIYAYLQQFDFTEFITGATVPHVYYRDYGESTAYHPSFEEQKKIGQLFKNLDKQISIEKEKQAKLEKLKQAYLNDMFV